MAGRWHTPGQLLFVLATVNHGGQCHFAAVYRPLYVAILGFWFLRERTTPFDWLIVLLTLCGIFLFFLDDLSPGNLLGNGFAALSGLCFGLFILCMRKQEDSSPMATVLLGNLVTAAAGLPFMFHTAPPDLAGWGALLLLGIFQLGLSYICYAIAVRSVTALEAVLIPVIEPLLNPSGSCSLSAKPRPLGLAGGLIVVISITAHSAVKTLKVPGLDIVTLIPLFTNHLYYAFNVTMSRPGTNVNARQPGNYRSQHGSDHIVLIKFIADMIFIKV